MIVSPPYKMSFVGGALLLRESLVVAEELLKQHDRDEVKKQVLNNNLLQARTQNTAKRLFSEVSLRLENLSEEELKTLVEVSERDQKHILWLAICRTYGFIHDFAVEILHPRFLNMQYELPKTEFDRFLEQKMSWHPHLEQLSESTNKKLRQVFFKMLKDVGFINSKYEIQGTILSPVVVGLLSNNPEEFRFYPATPMDIRRS